MNTAHPYKPSGYYFRAALRAAPTREEAIEVGLEIVAELEQLKMWVRDHGMIPPRWHLTPDEFREKAPALAVVCPFPSTAESSETAG